MDINDQTRHQRLDNLSVTSCHQQISSPTSVTNIDAAYDIHDMIIFETDPEQQYYLFQQQDQRILLLHQSLTFSESKHIPIRRLE